MAHMLAAATSFFSRTNISQSYNIGTSTSLGLGTRPVTPGSGPSTTSLSAPPTLTPTFYIGLWKVQSAWHKTTNKRVSVWTFDKRGPDMERLGAQGKDRVIEVMKAEASALGRLRHPSILEMVEPLEETRTELMFATEPVLSSLQLAIPEFGSLSSSVELDEIEIQKGILQLCKGLSFLHNSAKLIHSNICPESIIINGAGDWKIAGLGLTIPLQTAHGTPSNWEFPTFDGRIPAYIQRSFDYIGPEYALDEQLVTASDMYSLGCLVYAVHCKGNPPFKNHGSLGGLRSNASKPVPGIERLDRDLQVLLQSLITRHYGSRPTPEALPSHAFFSSLPISTLNFLDRSNFTAKTREEKISFMKGLSGVLDRFSDGLRTRKILPSLLEEMKDIHLLPYILPNVFAISQTLSPSQFATTVLPSLKPLFVIREPPQNMLTLLDNLTMLQDKTDKNVFREHVLPLVYHALESEHAIVQERALMVVPGLCETIDYAEIQGVLFPRVALVFTKTRILTVKVATLTTFLAMVKTLDQSSLTQKLVPLLSKIRTKEPAVMMATLSVQEAMGFKVDREAVATLVLPQLWVMSIGPLLSVGQFQRFMQVIKRLGDRVEKEHDQFLRDSQRLEDRSGLSAESSSSINRGPSNMDFECLVGTASAATVKPDINVDNNTNWNDDVWGSIFSNIPPGPQLPISSPASQPRPVLVSQVNFGGQLPSKVARDNLNQVRPSKLYVTHIPKSVTAPTSSTEQNLSAIHLPRLSSPPSNMAHPSNLSPLQQSQSQPLQPMPLSTPSKFSAPNYNIQLACETSTTPSAFTATSTPMSFPIPSTDPVIPLGPQQFKMNMSPFPAPPHMGGKLLVPSKPAQSSIWQNTTLSKDDWGDFDPLS
ncbi:kinase-like protein [Pholiota conissans]|uniref:Kinase-like protein n=1 Tax=Pholiota conissans TaxID=109636 RepID=A0A9P5YL87_9AGAR|nr:kinase-like protein [Pholiota conissans]